MISIEPSTVPRNAAQMSEFAGPNPFCDSPKSNTPRGIKSVFGVLADFQNLSLSPADLGRESLGIFNVNDFGQGALGFLGDDFGRESLGIVDLSSLDVGRASLGITNIKTYDFLVADVNLPKIPEEKNLGAEDDFEDMFNFAASIEASHLAEKVSDGSFIGPNNDTLDSTREPEGFVDISNEEAAIKCDTEEIFKNVDKLFGSGNRNQNNAQTDENLSNQLNESLRKEKTNTGRSSKSKNPIEIINSLSEILSHIPDEKRKSQGKSLLSSLAEIVLSNDSPRIFKDTSSPSFIENYSVLAPQADQLHEALDLRKKSNSDTNLNRRRPEVIAPLDLSMKSKSVCEKSPKILQAKFNKKQQQSRISNGTANSCSMSSNGSRNSGDLSKFKFKKADEVLAGAKRGPMRAVIPINNMAKETGENPKMTPKRSSSKLPNKSKRSSTPISESDMKPMAQSTPDNPRSSFPVSPLARPNSALRSSPKLSKRRFSISERHLATTKILDADNKRNSLLRRGSSGCDLKKIQNNEKPITRSSSLEGKSGIALISKQTSNRYSLPRFGGSVLKENMNRLTERPPGIRKSGKENL